MCPRFRRGARRSRHRTRDERSATQLAPAPLERAPVPHGESQGASSGVPIFLKELRAASPDAAAQAAAFAAHDAGRPLDAPTRVAMEPRLGHDLGPVRIHTGPEAADAARAVGARAYTAGTDVVFGAGEYAPSTIEGQRLLAHELTHVVQQSAASAHTAPTAEPSVGHPSDPLERAADRTAEQITGVRHDAPASPSHAATAPTATIQRQALPNAPDLTLRPSPAAARLLGSLTLDGFATDSPALTGEHRAALTGLAYSLRSLLRSYPTGTLSVTGHTDATGTEAHNASLGGERAAAVTAALVGEGIAPDIISTSSAGESELRESTPQASPRNRRVEIRFEPEQRGRLIQPLELPEKKPSAPVDLFPPSALPPETPTEKMKRILQPLPEVPPGPTISQVVLEKLDRAVNKRMEELGVRDEWRPYGRKLVRWAIENGVRKLGDQALDQLNIDANQEEAIRKAVDATLQTPLR